MPSTDPSTVAACYARAVLGATADGAGGIEVSSPPGERLRYAEMRAVWDAVIGADGADAHAGLRIGDRISPGNLHVLGHVVLTCESLAQAAEAAARYHPLVSQAGAVSVHRHGHVGRVRYRPTVDPSAMHPQQVEAVVAGIVRAARWIAGEDWAPLAVSFTHARTGPAEPYTRILGCPVTFDAAETAVTVTAEDLDRRRAPSDPELSTLHRAYADRLLHRLKTGTTTGDRVRQWLEHAPLDGVLPADVAQELHLSPRTLRRALHEEGTSWRALLDEARRTRAGRLLETTDLPLDRIAPVVGLSGATALVRAFTRWEGVTPGAYRGARTGPRR
ncbi:transcriptional regulator, AraC family [Actinobacteria bacterium OV450]|nr:transcriptional regulator, AraC family [Actinobacteria bacterium OV450]